MPDVSAAVPSVEGDTRPVADGLFTWPEDPRLIGASCRDCGTTTFPRQATCPRCTGDAMREVTLERRGRLWTWTIQGFEPKPPYQGQGEFRPYGVGYVELAAEADRALPVLVESRLSEADPGRLRIGAEMELEIVPFRHEPDGTTIVTFSFRPVED